MAGEIGSNDLVAFREMAASFAKRSIGPILDHESPDGDLSRLSDILDEANRTGLMASPRPDAPGYETGIWGRHALDHGPQVSLMLLEELAVACGGVAMNIHALGISSLILGMAKKMPAELPDRTAVALCEGGFPPGADTILDPSRNAPARIETVAEKEGGGHKITGRKDFVYQAPDTDAYLVFARNADKWEAFVVPADSQNLKTEDIGFRMGIRACPVEHVVMDGVHVPEDARLEFSRPLPEVVMEYLRLWWLGEVALGAGIARQAVRRARDYAQERYQGGTEIINHPGVGMLLSDSEARIMVCQGLIDRATSETGSASRSLLAAAKAKLMGMYAAAGAVTDSLQVFGGYGYMEDYRMEKLYRDVNTLKCVGGGPRDMRMIIAGLGREV